MSATRWLIEHKIDFSLNEIEIPLICLKLCSSVSCKVDLKVDCEGMDLELNEKLMGVNNFVQLCVECKKLWNQNWRNFVKSIGSHDFKYLKIFSNFGLFISF